MWDGQRDDFNFPPDRVRQGGERLEPEQRCSSKLPRLGMPLAKKDIVGINQSGSRLEKRTGRKGRLRKRLGKAEGVRRAGDGFQGKERDIGEEPACGPKQRDRPPHAFQRQADATEGGKGPTT